MGKTVEDGSVRSLIDRMSIDASFGYVEGSIQKPPDSNNFKQWIKSIGKSRSRHYSPSRYVMGWPEDESLDESYRMLPPVQDKQVDRYSVASSSFLRSIKTASISMGSASGINRPRTNTKASTHRSACHSSGFSGSDARKSADSNRLAATFSLDEGAWNRALQRRQIIREILDTEATYVAGLKALANVLSTFVVTRAALQRSTLDLLRLHEYLLAELRNVVPRTDYIGGFGVSRLTSRGRQQGISSLDARLTETNLRTFEKQRGSVDSRIKSSKSVAAEPKEAAEIARILQRMLPRFVAYEDYSIKYQLVSKEVDFFRKSISSWQTFDHGIEALSKSVASLNSRGSNANHCLTFGDLLMKPIQRVCKYHLFLADLLKCTPVADCPISHSTIDHCLQRMLEVSQAIDRATGDPTARDRVQKSLLLRDRLVFPKQIGDRDILRELGPIKVCGVLHVAYQTQNGVFGDYMLCALFGTYLLLATASSEHKRFDVVALIRNADLKVECAENETGLYCDDIEHSWKILLTSEDSVFELVMSACSEKEAAKWKDHLVKRTPPEASLLDEKGGTYLEGSIVLPRLQPLSAVVIAGQVHSLTRRSSVHSALTKTASNADRIRLLIKGTDALHHDGHSTSPIGRSQSLHSSRQIVVLAPKRQDRIRMERWLSDIWTSDVLPYPGMLAGRGEHLIRSSAESFMRRLSIRRPRAFTRRPSSLSVASLANKAFEPPAICEIDSSMNEKDGADTQKVSLYGGEDGTEEKVSIGYPSFSVLPPTDEKDRYEKDIKEVGFPQLSGSGRFRGSSNPFVRKKWSVSLFKAVSPKSQCSCQIGI